jgi:hypothetical protein
LAGLLPSLHPDPAELRQWLQLHRPGSILAANVMGQFGVVAQRLVEGILGAVEEPDPDRPDPLSEALEVWTARVIEAFLKVLQESGADLWLIHDRAVVFSGGDLVLGPWTNDWIQQLQPERMPLEAHDPLAGQDVVALLGKPEMLRQKERWIWDLAPGQRHLVEALAWLPQKQ